MIPVLPLFAAFLGTAIGSNIGFQIAEDKKEKELTKVIKDYDEATKDFKEKIEIAKRNNLITAEDAKRLTDNLYEVVRVGGEEVSEEELIRSKVDAQVEAAAAAQQQYTIPVIPQAQPLPNPATVFTPTFSADGIMNGYNQIVNSMMPQNVQVPPVQIPQPQVAPQLAEGVIESLDKNGNPMYYIENEFGKKLRIKKEDAFEEPEVQEGTSIPNFVKK